ncbi:terminal uridylyltransferase Tailor-like [Drosophila obscura]|uniref:terminal uridylyltransferase Tailor-like n=1 Tax=Drosophila obscura TaxID=7282 RepID=UPI000BA03691|nr:terminal uridylyltransferase Tailor-like [Drosophila obscura]
MGLNSENFWQNLLEHVAQAAAIQENSKLSEIIKNDLKKTLQWKFPLNMPFEVRLFGSRIMGVGSFESDLDILVVLGNSCDVYNEKLTPKVMSNLDRITNAILENGSDWDLKKVNDRYFPLVTVLHKGTNIKCDINFLNSMSCDQNQLVNYIFKLQPMARYMVIFLRAWSQEHGIKKYFRSHIFILLVIFFLQVQGHLPAVKELQAGLLPNIPPWTSNFNEFPLSTFGMKEIEVNENQTRQILFEFFKYYSTFAFDEFVVCPYLGKCIFRRKIKETIRVWYRQDPLRTAVFIQDLILLVDNKGFRINAQYLREFQHQCSLE